MHAYHLVLVTAGREPVLTDDFARSVMQRVETAASTCSFDLLAYTIMPDHVHLLALGITDDADAISFMKRLKQTTSYDFIQRDGRRLWQQSFFDHVLRRDEDALAIAKYIVENPVRAGYVERLEDWPYFGGTLVADGTGRT